MARDTSKHRTTHLQRQRLAAIVALGCSMLSLALIPAATAKSTKSPHVKTTTTSTAPASAPASSVTPEAPAAGATLPSPAEHGASKAAKHAKHKTAGPGGAATPSTAKPASGARAALTPEQRRLEEREAKPKNGRVSREQARQAEGSRSTPSSTGSTTTATPAVVASATPSLAATVPAAQRAPASTPKAGAPSSAGRGRAFHARRQRHASTSPTVAAGGVLSGAVGPVLATAPSTPSPATSRSLVALDGTGSIRHRSTGSPIASTITRIVDVVPMPVRVLIGLLIALALALAVRSRFAAARARRLERQRGQLLEDVGLLQAALLPVPPARLGPVGTTAAYRPAAGPAAGGDFYDVFALADGQLAVILGDVSGHGRQALPHTALVRFTLRAYLEAGLSPRGALQTAGAVLERQLGSSFATVVAATYNPRERVLVYAGAGHPPPVIVGSDAAATPLTPITLASAPPIGAGMPTGTRQTTVSIPGAAQICFYTDGVTEARVGAGFFGADRLTQAVRELGPRASAAMVLDRVADEADRRPDDMAACTLSIAGRPGRPRVLAEELELDRDAAASQRTEQFLLACGVAAPEAATTLESARAAAIREGTVVIELRPGDGPPAVTLAPDNLTYLATRQPALGVSP